MEEYKILSIVLFALIIASESLPQNARQASSDIQQSRSTKLLKNPKHNENDLKVSDGTQRQAEITGHLDAGSVEMLHGRRKFSAAGKGLQCIEDVCEMAIDYPYDHIEKVVGQLLDKPNSSGSFVGNILENGTGTTDFNNIENICQVTVHAVYPKVMKNNRNVVKYIVNTEKYRQGVVFEICMSENIDSIANIDEGYNGACYQLHSGVKLLAITADGEAVYESFIVPSFCDSISFH